MRVSLRTDNTLFLPIDSIVARLNTLCTNVSFVQGDPTVHFDEPVITCPASFMKLVPQLGNTADVDLSVVFTSVPYENNFFYEDHQSILIASASNWHLLTDQPLINGVFYFIAIIVAQTLDFGEQHVKNRGCVNDVLIDKTGVDMGMRAASLCPDCKADLGKKGIDASDLLALLDAVSRAARTGMTILDCVATDRHPSIDLFLCYNSHDKSDVRSFNDDIKSRGLVTWLDEDDLEPGSDWQQVIQEAIPRVKAAAVCVGTSAIGPWQRMEIKGLLSEFVERGCRVVPVILPSAPTVPELPLFLRQFVWLDLRKNAEQAVNRLVSVLR